MKKLLAFLGSPRINGNSSSLAHELLKGAKNAGAQTEAYVLNQLNFKGCQGCFFCRSHDFCILKDDLTPALQNIKTADVVVIASPFYMWSVTGQTKLFLDRLLPFIGDHFTPRYAPRKTIMLYSQGNPNLDKFRPYFNELKELLSVGGFMVEKELIAVKADIPGKMRNHEVLAHAYQLGQELAQ